MSSENAAPAPSHMASAEPEITTEPKDKTSTTSTSTSTTTSTSRRAVLVHEPTAPTYACAEANIKKPHTDKLAHALIHAYNLQQQAPPPFSPPPAPSTNKTLQIIQPPLLPAVDVARFHTDAYVRFLQHIEYHAHDIADEAHCYVLNNSVCFSETAWPYSQLYAGASVAAAEYVATNKADVAINFLGGQTHARRDCASGQSYVNDAVLCTLSLLCTFERIMFVNLDACHASGVEEAFYTTDRVLCLSLHRLGDGFFPGSGGAADVGEGAGRNHNVNLPVREGLTDEHLAELFAPVLAAAAERFQPFAVVFVAGPDVLAGDRVGGLNVSVAAYVECVHAVLSLGRPTVVLGGMGHSGPNAARAWCAATAAVCGVELADQVPEHDYYEYYAPSYRLEVHKATADDMNSAESVAATRNAALATIAAMPQRMPPPTPAPPLPKPPPAPPTVASEPPPAPAVPSAAEADATAATGEASELGTLSQPPPPQADADTAEPSQLAVEPAGTAAMEVDLVESATQSVTEASAGLQSTQPLTQASAEP